MKTSTQHLRYLGYGLCLAVSLYNCKPKDVESLTPFTYTFKGFDDVKLPDIVPTEPAAVVATAGSVASSTVTAAVSSGLANMMATGQVPAAVQQAAAAVNQAVPAEKATQLVASFTPDVINSLATSGVPASMKADIAAIAANPALAAYWPKFTMPTVNGKAVGGRIGVGTTATLLKPVIITFARADDDACKSAASAAVNTALEKLKQTRDAQTAAVNQTFDQRKGAAQNETATCKSSKTSSYATMRTDARKQYDQTVASLETGKTVLGETMYNLLKVMYSVAYAQTLEGISTLERADATACEAVTTTKITNAETAKTTDLNKVTAGFNNAEAALTKALNQAIASCHNQGNGG
ncbi:hypothetical protein [Fibrivirga algicola]|uniref:Lipoprotein n=1 Tax=Fibrivirga algicola TaxID=2950420 RepID=A0ABX0QIN6_9BACT|nr:hypothetical protein [Fibrivirga algicola]ARK12572.1 hypothetical protein A6C57_20775 [Fibrella sp. ES10-3-2-2]NID12275.1 hypothetical protein [Fibrivirga algicola]